MGSSGKLGASRHACYAAARLHVLVPYTMKVEDLTWRCRRLHATSLLAALEAWVRTLGAGSRVYLRRNS